MYSAKKYKCLTKIVNPFQLIKMKYLLITIFVLTCSFILTAQDTDLDFFRGVVVDSNGTPVKNARIQISFVANKISNCLTDQDGKFKCWKEQKKTFSLTITADGFSILRRNFIDTQDSTKLFEFVLEPESLRETVTVTTNRTETLLSETPASIVSISRSRLESAASPAVDDVLRQTIGFSLFRRSNSRNANPTTQGTSLRGINASGASRSIVSLDGIPVNDFFGGWVGWSKVPQIGIERIEVLRGGSSSIYGSDALGGAINLISKKTPEDESFIISAEVFGGTQNTFSGSTFFGVKKYGWSGDFVVSTFQTKGYRIVDKGKRGLADDFANSHNSNFSGRIGRDLGNYGSLFFKVSYFGEARNNGTPVQKNRTHFRQFAIGADFDVSKNISRVSDSFSSSNLRFRAFGGTQGFDQKFSAVAGDRNTERLVRIQRVPSQVVGGSGQFSTVFKSNTFLVGFEASETRGSSNEIGFFGGSATSRIGSGGRETSYSIYFQDFAKLGERIILVGNMRYDAWRNTRALSSLFRFSTNLTATTVFPDRKQSSFSPSGSILFRASDELSIYFNASRSFRAPTLNELYRGFRVGSVITDPNEDLVAEKANNFEGGASYGRRNINLRGNFYWTEVSDSIANVTVSGTPTLIFRQRQNAGKIRVRGMEFEAEARIRDFRFSFGYLLADAEFAHFPANPNLVGLRIPQVPRHQFTFQTGYANSKGWSFSLQGRASSKQFDNDLNTLRLEPYFQLDAFAAKRFRENWQVFVGVENVFNSRYSVGRTPVRTVSSPLNARIGLRWN